MRVTVWVRCVGPSSSPPHLMSQLPAPTSTSQCPLTTLSPPRYGGGGGWLLRITRAATTGLTGRPNVPGQRPGQRQQRGGGGKMKRKVGGSAPAAECCRADRQLAPRCSQPICPPWRQPLLSLLLLAAPGGSARKQSADRVYISCLVPCRARNCAASPAPRRQP